METETKKNHEYKFIIDNKHHVWPEQYISGLQLKQAAGVDPATYSVYMRVPGAEDPEIADGQKVELSTTKEEVFFTGKKHTTEGCDG
jgi:Multiubiquitin